jgi:L-threonylcarbamoyladenylate synthase
MATRNQVIKECDAEAISEAVSALEQGKLIVIPTETVYGLVADLRVPGATERLYEAKQRDRGKPLQLLISDVDIIRKLGFTLTSLEQTLAEAFWPGPLTLIVKNDGGSEGFRVPASTVALGIAGRVGGALRATSANVSGEAPALTAGAAYDCLGSSVSVILNSGPVEGGIASTVVRVRDENRIEILREGAISRNAIKKFGMLYV